MKTWINGADRRFITPNRYTLEAHPDRIKPVECVVLHYTAGGSATSSARWLCNLVKDADGRPIPARASAHLVISRTGKVYQLAPLTDRTWHAGGRSSRWNGLAVNPISIGIELANMGRLSGTGPDDLRDTYGRAWSGAAMEAGGHWWEPYPAQQLKAASDLVSELVGLFPRLATGYAGCTPRICGHSEVDPTRKVDPGPLFPLEALR
jgi:N-acetyl-anhydromuramyl-L-alanine amidase AmpD